MESKVSIIIPVYNTEKFIPKCVDSVLNQSYENMEIILVNDGSTDNSLSVCKYYEKNDNRVKVINKINGGLSDARNFGLKNSTGKYILFLDSDDYWKGIDSLKNLINCQKETNADVILFNMTKFFEDKNNAYEYGKKFDRSKIKNKDKKYALKWLLSNNLYIASACNKMISRKLFEDNMLWFEKDLLSEDIDWCIRLMMCANTFDCYDDPFYMYRQQRKDSISNSIGYKHIKDMLKICINYIEFINEKYQEEEKEIYLNFLAYYYIIIIGLSFQLNNKNKKEMLRKVKENKYILNYNWNFKVKKISILYNILGFNLTSYILGIYFKYK